MALSARPATPDDAVALTRLMFVEPGREAIAMIGDPVRAERFRTALLRDALVSGRSAAFVASDGADLVGFAEMTAGRGDVPPGRVVVKAALVTLGVPRALRSAWRARARARVDITAPEGGVHLVELQVRPDRRGQGVGAFLLAEVDRYARAQSARHVSLTTTTDNPARRLYERSGYGVIETRTDRVYERLTRSAGRVLLVKPL